MQIIRSIQNRIYEIRGERVMLDRDLAVLLRNRGWKSPEPCSKTKYKAFSTGFYVSAFQRRVRGFKVSNRNLRKKRQTFKVRKMKP